MREGKGYITIPLTYYTDFPDASDLTHGQMRIVWIEGQDNSVWICLKKADDSYAWFQVGATEP
jgi:hypothetical protein